MTTSARPVALPARRDLTDGVVLLRRPGAADVPAIVRAVRDPEVVRYTRVPSPYAESDAHGFLQTAVEQGWNESSSAVFAVCAAAEPETLLGMIGLHDVDLTGDPGGVAEVGYWMSPEGRGRGLMARALRVISTWAVDELGLTRITWYAVVGNEASRRTAERAGYVVEGLLRRGESIRGRRLDHWVGSLLPEDLLAGDEPGERA
jgi:RimJ/RimL family protein N-acetyltransferase